MLKLEKNSKSLVIRIREKESFFSFILFKAFLIALLIHLGIVILFHIQPFMQTGHVHPPIQVQMDRRELNQMTWADDSSNADFFIIPEPPLELFIPEFFPEIESQITQPDFELTKRKTLLDTWESRLIVYQPPELPKSMAYQPIQLFISGELASRQLKNYDSRINETVYGKIQEWDPVYISFKVYVDAEGSVFWHELQQSTGNKKQNKLAEELLQSLEFTHSKLAFNISGRVDFVLYQNNE